MAQNIGDTLGMLTLYEAYCGACVSEVMKPYLRRTARLQQGFEAPVEQIAWIDCRALLRSEHQLVPSICHTMSCEGFYGGSRELYAPNPYRSWAAPQSCLCAIPTSCAEPGAYWCRDPDVPTSALTVHLVAGRSIRRAHRGHSSGPHVRPLRTLWPARV